jgi:hypothetical protein
MSFDIHNIYHPLIVNSGWTSQSISATTISAGTFYGGSLSATYVGNQNVTNQEFRYVSGLTSNTQTQLNNLVNRTERLLTFQSDDFLNNDRIVSSGNNINFGYTSTHLGISASFPSIEVATIGVSLSSSQTAITNFNPVGWNDSVTNSTNIIITGNSYSIISGLVGGVNGRIAIISNFGSGLVILENNSSATTVGNQFKFSSNFPYFLHNNRSITLIYYSGLGWTNYFELEDNGFLIFDDFLGTIRERYHPLGIYFFSSKTGGNISSNAGIIITGTTGFGEAKIYTVTAATSTTQRSAQFGAIRQSTNKNNTVSLGKIKIFGTTGFNSTNNSCSFGTFGTLQNNGSNPTNANSTFPTWVTPITSVTQSNTTNWYTKQGSSSKVTNIDLNYCVNNWIYLGVYFNNSITNLSDNRVAFFYSFDNKNYFWSSIETNITGIAQGSSTGICANCATNNNNHLPFILSDWFGYV